MIQFKLCTKCHIRQPRENFYKAARQSSGLRPRCISCELEYFRQAYASNPERFRKRGREYYYANRSKQIEKRRDYQRRMSESFWDTSGAFREAT